MMSEKTTLVVPEERKIQDFLEIMGGKNPYQIPSYQRPYEWSLANNKQFFRDLTDRDGYSNIGDRRENILKYFLGPVYIHRGYILDGQQRMTSLAIWNNAEIEAGQLFDSWVKGIERRTKEVLDACEKIKRREESDRSRFIELIEVLDQAYNYSKEKKLGLRKSKFGLASKRLAQIIVKANELVTSDDGEQEEKEPHKLAPFVHRIKALVKAFPKEDIGKLYDELQASLKDLEQALKPLSLPKIEVKKGTPRKVKLLQIASGQVEIIGGKLQSLTSTSIPDTRVYVKSENHVKSSVFKDFEIFWRQTLTGRFDWTKAKGIDDWSELKVELVKDPKNVGKSSSDDDKAISEDQIARKWQPLDSKRQPQIKHFTLRQVISAVEKNNLLAPHEKSYVLAYVFYFYQSLGTILKKADSLFRECATNLSVWGDSASLHLLSELTADVVITQMTLHGNLGIFDAQKMFHTINARGVGLSHADIVRNLLISGKGEADHDKEVELAFSGLVNLYFQASSSNLNLGFSEDDVFYWAHQSVNNKEQIAEKKFIEDVEKAIDEGGSDGAYNTQFVSYVNQFCSFFDWLIDQEKTLDFEKAVYREYRLIMILSFPKATYPLLISLYNQHHQRAIKDKDYTYLCILMAIGFYFAQRRAKKFPTKQEKVEGFTQLIKRTHRAASQLIDHGSSAEGLVNWGKIWFPTHEPSDREKKDPVKPEDYFLTLLPENCKFGFENWKTTALHKDRYYQNSNNQSLTRYLLYGALIKTGKIDSVRWDSDIEHLLFLNSEASCRQKGRLGNLFIMRRDDNRSLQDLSAEKKFEKLEKKYMHQPTANSYIKTTPCFEWLEQHFVEYETLEGGEKGENWTWKSKSLAEKKLLLKEREKDIFISLCQRHSEVFEHLSKVLS